MDTATAERIATETTGDRGVAPLAHALRNLVCQAREKGLYKRLFMLHKESAISELSVPANDLELLCASKVLQRDTDSHTVRSNLMVHYDPHQEVSPELQRLDGIIIATDWPDTPPLPHPSCDELCDGREMVFPLHYESFAILAQLATHLASGMTFKTVLDVFCGSGVLGIYAAKLGCSSVVFVDNYLRSLAFAKLNSHLNGITNAAFVRSDCVTGLSANHSFDLVLANPPFEPVSDEDRDRYFYHSYGGPFGQTYMDRFLSNVVKYVHDTSMVISVNFLTSNIAGTGLHAHIDEIRFHRQLSSANASLTVFGQTPLKTFWLRYDALAMDSEHRLLDGFIRSGRDFLYLCVLTIDFAATPASRQSQCQLRFENTPSSFSWWNPMGWALPCGVKSDELSIRYWIAHSLESESETRGDQSALHAESITTADESSEVQYWDFHAALRDYQRFSSSTMMHSLARALKSTVLDFTHVSLATAVMPQDVTLLLLPGRRAEGADASTYLRIHSSSLRTKASRSRTETVDAIDIEEREINDHFYREVSGILSDRRCLVFLYTLSNPEPMGFRHILDLPDYSLIASGKLIWREKTFSPPDFHGREVRRADIMRLQHNDVQRYIVVIGLPPGGEDTLDIVKGMFPVKPVALIYTQCYRFMRDRMTLLAIPMISAGISRADERSRERERLMAYTSHTVFGPTASALYYLGRAEENDDPGKDIRRA